MHQSDHGVGGEARRSPSISLRSLFTLGERGNTLPYLIIALLAVIIVVGSILLLSRESREAVKVELFTPTNEVPQTTNFTVSFSKDLVHDSVVNKSLDAAPVEFDPRIPGKFEWIARNKLRFYPDVVLSPSTRYTAEILPRIAADYGYALRGDRKYEFYTPAFRVNSAWLTYELTPESDQQANLFASIEFNYEVDPKEVAKHISVQYEGGGSLPFTLQTENPSAIFALKVEGAKRGEQEKQVQLRVSKGLKPIGGKSGLADDYTKPISLPGREELRVESVLPVRESANRQTIRIAFNLPINGTTATPFVSVEPFISYKLTYSHNYIDLHGEFDAKTTYQVKLRKGLKAIDGSQLKRDFANAVTLARENIQPQVGFVGDGFYLNRTGNLNVGVSTINVDKLTVEVEKVFANNLTYLLNMHDLAREGHNWGYYSESDDEGEYYSGYRSDLAAVGTLVHQEDVIVANRTNEEIVTPINVKDYLDNNHIGIYRITARQATERWNNSTRWVVATDLGILAKVAKDDLWIWVNSLTTLKPIADAELKLVSQNNQTIATAKTDGDGIAIFKNYQTAAGDFRPFVIIATLGNDISFVELTRRMIPTTDFEVDGKPYLSGGLEAFLYTERGIYRPGETVHLAAVVRGAEQTVPPSFPSRFKVTGPDGKIVFEQKATLNDQGAAGFDVVIPDYLLTGKYLATMLIGENEEIGRTSFNIEEFVPDRMKVKVAADREYFASGDRVSLAVDAVTLFGPPASNRRVQGDILLEPFTFTAPKWKSFVFSDEKKSFTRQTEKLADTLLDDNGRFTYHYAIPKDLTPPSAIKGTALVTVLEPGGRGVTAAANIMVHPYGNYIGLRQNQEGYAKPGAATEIEFVAVNPSGEAVSGRNVEVAFTRVYWQSILKYDERYNSYRYVSEEVEGVAEKFNVTSIAGVGSFKVTPDDYGKYRVVARDVESGASASLWFYASGWGYAPWAMDHPDRIELDLDKDSYLPGEMAQVQIRAPFAGKLLLTIEREKVFEHRVIMMKENTATISLPVSDLYKPNAYISAHLIRSTEKLGRDMHVRAFGAVPLKVSTDRNKLAVELQVPTEIRPKTKLNINFKITGQTRGTPYLTIAAVDEGICQLTDFQTPDPHGFFFSKKQLSVQSYDVYGVVLPEISISSPSGDLGAAARRRLMPISVTRVAPVAFWSGLVKTDAQGNGMVSFDVPQFNGSIRVMAVAFAGDKFGKAEKNLFVREPIVLTPTFPRFIGSTDELTIPVSVYNGTGADATFTVNLSATGPVKLVDGGSRSIKISAGRELPVYYKLKAEQTMGKVQFKLAASGNGATASQEEELALRPPVPFVTLSGNGSVTSATPAAFKFPADWIAGTTDFTLSTSSFPTVRFAGSLQYLLGYPHGCVEQTTSKLFPMLYFDELARLAEPELFKKNSVDYYIEEGITKLANMQMTSGAFSYWPQGNFQNNWSSIYAGHFLVEARKAGYTVSDRVYDRMISALQSFARDYRAGMYDEYQSAVYANYVLALAGKSDRSTLFYLKDNAISQLKDYSRFQLIGALAMAGDLANARQLMPKTILATDTLKEWESGGNFNSPIRARAIMLDVLSEVEPTSPLVPKLVESLSKAINPQGRWYTTQENAYALMALGKVMKKQPQANFTGTVQLNGVALGQIDNQNYNFRAKDWAGKEVTIKVNGSGVCYFYWRADGLPSTLKIDEYDNDIQVRRRYLDENGNPVNYAGLRQGDMVIAEITVKALSESIDNVAIIDMLPAAFEIENPRLQSRKGITWIGDKAYDPLYMDIRDDRMVLYGNFPYGKEMKCYYGIRVVSEGSFIVPPVRAEAMYAPMKASVASSGKVEVGRP